MTFEKAVEDRQKNRCRFKCFKGGLPHAVTPNGRYFHFRHLMKILVLILLIFTYLNLFFDIFKGSELIIYEKNLVHILKNTIDHKKYVKKIG